MLNSTFSKEEKPFYHWEKGSLPSKVSVIRSWNVFAQSQVISLQSDHGDGEYI